MGIFHLFTLARGAARLGDAHVQWVHLVLQSEVTGTGLTIVLPTCDPDDLDPEFFDGWLTAIQGPIVTGAADDDDDQRAFLLRVVLTYRAFATRHPSLTLSQYIAFTTMFVVSALALDSDEDAATDLAEIDQWMTDNIPLDILEPRDLPPRTEEVLSSPPASWGLPGHAVTTTDLWTSPAIDSSTFREAVHILSTGVLPPRPSPFAERSTSRAPGSGLDAGASASARASTAFTHVNGIGAGNHATTLDENTGYDSDSSMPGLKTPSDGSDAE